MPRSRQAWKSEARNPNPEGNPKFDILIVYGTPDHVDMVVLRTLQSNLLAMNPCYSLNGALPFRISDFGLPSDFGFRVSDLLANAPGPCERQPL
jgi:hypothetical protein